jgi:ubiquinone/menaquinone biosynthesis C-methylase UbiE
MGKQKELNSRFIRYLKLHSLNDPWKQYNHEKLLNGVFSDIDLKKIETVLDAGCGDGLLFPIIAKKLPWYKKLVGFDIINSEIWPKIKLKSLSFFIASANKIPLSDKSFDLVLCKDVLHHVKNPQKIVKELIRISKRLVIIIEANRENPLMALYTKIQGDDHYIKASLKYLIERTVNKESYHIKEVDAYPFYFPIITKGWLSLPLLFLNGFYVISFKFLKIKSLAKIISRIMTKILKEPSFNVIYIWRNR